MMTITSRVNHPIHVTAIDGSKHRLSARGSVTVPGLDPLTETLLKAQGYTIAQGTPSAHVMTMPGVPVASTMPGVPAQPVMTMPGVPRGRKGKR